MTWEQALSAALAIGITALARFVNQKLPPVFEQDKPPGDIGSEWANTEPMAGPPAGTEGGAAPPPGYHPPTPPSSAPALRDLDVRD